MAAPAAKKDFSIQEQKKTFWCWAAVAASIRSFFNPPADPDPKKDPFAQCNIATQVLHDSGGDCCANPNNCNHPEMLEHALTVTGNLDAPRIQGVASFDSLKAQTDRGLPVCVRIQWAGGNGGHFIVIDSCQVSGSEQVVHVADPWHGDYHYLRYADVVNNYVQQGSQWSDTFLVNDADLINKATGSGPSKEDYHAN